jgi:hypothetical protein
VRSLVARHRDGMAAVSKDLDRLLTECLAFQDRVLRGEAKLGEKKVDIIPPDPIGELGSGFDRIASGQVERPTPLTIGRS